MVIKIFPLKNSEETCTMYSKSDNIEVTMGSEANKIIEELFYSH